MSSLAQNKTCVINFGRTPLSASLDWLHLLQEVLVHIVVLDTGAPVDLRA